MSLAESVEEYYRTDPSKEERLQQILNKQAGFSLREIDWFVTNMSARKPQIYRNSKTGRIVDVNSDYKDVLRCYHKANFDSFKRRGEKTREQELKQKNFFRWAFENGIVDKVSESIQEIKEDMCEMKKRHAEDEPQKKRRRGLDEVATTIVHQPVELKIPNFTNIVW